MCRGGSGTEPGEIPVIMEGMGMVSRSETEKYSRYPVEGNCTA